MKTYRLTYEIVIDVEAEDENQAIEKGDEEWVRGDFELYPYIEEMECE